MTHLSPVALKPTPQQNTELPSPAFRMGKTEAKHRKQCCLPEKDLGHLPMYVSRLYPEFKMRDTWHCILCLLLMISSWRGHFAEGLASKPQRNKFHLAPLSFRQLSIHFSVSLVELACIAITAANTSSSKYWVRSRKPEFVVELTKQHAEHTIEDWQSPGSEISFGCN